MAPCLCSFVQSIDEALDRRDIMDKNAAQDLANSNEYATMAVPQSARRGFWGLLMVWMGYVFVVTTMQVGGTMAKA